MPIFRKGNQDEHERSWTGGDNPNAKLSEDDVTAIRDLVSRGWSDERIAGLYGVVPLTIKNIRDGKTHKRWGLGGWRRGK